MVQGKAEDAGGLTPAKDDNTALCHFGHRTLPIFKCVDYKGGPQPLSGRGWHGAAVTGGIPFIDGLPEHGIPPPPPSAAVPLPLAREAWGAPLSSPAGKGPLAKGGFGGSALAPHSEGFQDLWNKRDKTGLSASFPPENVVYCFLSQINRSCPGPPPGRT